MISLRRSKAAANALVEGEYSDIIFCGDSAKLIAALPDASVDVVFSSPPYCMGKAYEQSSSVDDFIAFHRELVPELVRLIKPGGSICWQVGYHSNGDRIVPLDFLAHAEFAKHADLRLRNRIVWTFAHGLHAKKRFSGRHETVLWYQKGDSGLFDLDAVRVPQKYPGKRSYKGPNKGNFSGNPLGKNPGDVWHIPNVKGHHVEKTEHPCQFPVALPLQLLKAVCPRNGIVFDPFMGVGTTGVAAALAGSRFLGAELLPQYLPTARRRIRAARSGAAVYRPLEQAIHQPRPTDAVARRPDHFRG